jgi:hypothetical protein
MGNMLWPASIARCSYESTLENLVPNLQTIHDAHACAHDLEYVRAVSGTSAYIKSSKLTAMANHHSLIINSPYTSQDPTASVHRCCPRNQPRSRCCAILAHTRCRPLAVRVAGRSSPTLPKDHAGAPTSPRKGNKKKVHTPLLPWLLLLHATHIFSSFKSLHNPKFISCLVS